jgi:hypothetical protein
VAEPQRPQKPDYEQAAKDVEAMRQQLHLQVPDRETTRRDLPPWNPASPYRSLKDIYIAALSGCSEITARLLEEALTLGKAKMAGTRSDRPSVLLPARIEMPVAKAQKHAFFFDDNRIFASYISPDERRGQTLSLVEILHPYPPIIIFDNVRVHWPNLVNTLHEVGFDITVDSKKPANSREPNTKSDSDKENEFKLWMNSEEAEHGRYPPRDKNKKFPDRKYYRKWGIDNGVSREMLDDWVEKNELKHRKGRPGNLAKK